MKEKSGVKVLAPAASPKKPFVRNTKRRGEIVELAFLHKVADMGFAVTKPYGDSEPYDFIVDSGSQLWRVQVKSGGYRSGRAYRVGVHHLSHTVPAQKAYTAKQIDILAVYIVPAHAWYVIPVSAFSPRTSLKFFPHVPGHAGEYEQFRDAWFLMACRRNGEPREGIITSPPCSYSTPSGSPCPGCPRKKK
jgi:hypothetical protein